MTKTGKKVIYVSKEVHKTVSRFAKQHEMDLGQAVERLVTVAIGRLQALQTYSKAQREKVAA